MIERANRRRGEATHAVWVVFAILAVGGAGLAGGASGSPAGVTVRGQVTTVSTEAPLEGATVKIRGVGSAITDANGRYSVRIAAAPAGTYKAVIRAPGHRRRNAWVQLDGSSGRTRASWNLLPKRPSALFDVELFDFLARAGNRANGTSRWDAPPTVRIFANRINCPAQPGLVDETCPSWTVETPVPAARIQELSAAIADAWRLFASADQPTIELVRYPEGAQLSTQDVLVPGALTVGQYPEFGGGILPAWAPGTQIAGKAVLIPGFLDHAGVALNTAKALGLGGGLVPSELCQQQESRGLRTLFCARVQFTLGITEADLALGRALYSRPVGNRYPDKDPMPAR